MDKYQLNVITNIQRRYTTGKCLGYVLSSTVKRPTYLGLILKTIAQKTI